MHIDFNNNITWIKSIIITLWMFTVCCVIPALAQDAIISFQLRPPFNQPVENYKDQLTINLTNPSADVMDGFLEVSIFNSDKSIYLGSLPSGRKRVSLEPGTTTFTGSDLDDLLAINQLEIRGVDPNEVFFDQGLSPGRYYLCLVIYNQQNRPVSNTACTNFQVNVPAVSTILSFLPPYNVPFGEFSNQVNLTFLSTAAISGMLELSITDLSGSTEIKKRAEISLDQGSNNLNGLDLEYFFSPGEFIAMAGISENQLFASGLSSGNYLMTFSLSIEGVSVAVANQQFMVPASAIIMTTRITPAYDVSLPDLLAQTSLSIQSSAPLADSYITLEITGENLLIQSDKTAVIENVDLEANSPQVLSAGDLLDVNGSGVIYEGISQANAVEQGLPPGNYAYCYRLYNTNDQLLTEIPACFSLVVPEPMFNLMVQAIPPYSTQIEDVYDMLRVSVSASRYMKVGFYVAIVGDNGIQISRNNLKDASIILEKNAPQILDGADLYPFFNLDQFNFGGITRNEIEENGLPEGNYQVCLTPYWLDGYSSPNPRESCSNSFPVRYVEPPQLLTPECGQVVDISRGQFIMFNWLPAPGAPAASEYTLRVVEMRIPGQNPYDALLTATNPPFFEETVMGNSYLYGPGDPLLEPGFSYAYQVYLNDQPVRGNYNNQGFSADCYFIVQDSTLTDDVLIEDDLVSRNKTQDKIVEVNPIRENPFPGFQFPVTQVSGQLHYKFFGSGFYNQSDQNQTNLVAQMSNADVLPINGSSDGLARKSDEVRVSPNPVFNQDNVSTIGAKPLANVAVKLIAGYLFYGNNQGTNVQGDFMKDPWGSSYQTIASTITDSEGNFEFTFYQSDSIGQPFEVSAMVMTISPNALPLTGTLFKVYRLIVDSPYYYSPEMNLVVQPWEHLDVGNLVSLVKSYNLKVIAKTGAYGAYFADQKDGVGTPIPEAKTTITRPYANITAPANEGQDLPAEMVAEGTTDVNGAVVFKNMVRHNYNNPYDKYTITCKTSENIAEYNYQITSQSFPLTSFSEGPYSYTLPIEFNSEWEMLEYVDTVTMQPKLPRIYGEVNGIQPPADLPKTKSRSGEDDQFSRSASNSTFQNLASTALYQSDMSFSAFENLIQQNQDWSEMVNKEALPDVKVQLVEINKYWKTNNTSPINKLKKITDPNGQFSFDQLQLEITSEYKVDGPARVLSVNHPGYKSYTKAIPPQGYLKWGQQYNVDDILLEPDGFVYGYVENEKGNPVKAEVFVGEFTSATTVQSQEIQDLLGLDGNLKEIFVIKAPSGDHVQLHIVPDNPIYVPADFTVAIAENNNLMPQNLGGFAVGLFKHRIILEVTEEKLTSGNMIDGKFIQYYPPVKNALVKVTSLLAQGPKHNTQSSQPANNQAINPDQNQVILYQDDVIYGYTDEFGYVTLSFSNNSQEFVIEVIPPVDKALVKKTVVISSEPSGQPVYAGRVILEKAWSIAGQVTYGPDSLPLAHARVYVDEDIEVFTDNNGQYTLSYIPQLFNQYTITAENHNHPLTMVADSKNIQFPYSGNLDFNLTLFDQFEIKELMGLPVTVKTITPDGENYLLDGAFINLPDNPNFTVKEENTQLDFYQVPITSVQKNGKMVAQAVNKSILLDEMDLKLINYTKFIARQTPESGNQLQVKADENGLGSVMGKVTLLNSSFHFNENYMSFNEETSSSPVSQNYSLIQPNNQTVQDDIQRSYIDLFQPNSQFRLSDSQQNASTIKSLSAGNYPLQSFRISDQNYHDYEFKIQDFKARARKADSYIFKDTLVLATTIIADQIPLAIPKTLEIDAGDIRVSAYGFDQLLGGEPISFQLEQWQVTCDNWTLDPEKTGILASTGQINFGLFTTEIKDIKILPHDLQLGGLDLNKFELGGIVPVNLKTNMVSFGIDQAAGSDNKPHWSLNMIGFNNEPAASIQGLPGMKPQDEINMQEVLLLSNGEQEMIIGNQDKQLTFYNIIKVTPDVFIMLDGGLQLSAALDLEIPLLQPSYGSFRYTKENGVLQSQFLGMDVDFTMPGNTMFVGGQELGAQTLQQNKFEATGYIKHEEKVKLLTRLEKNLDSTFVVVDPLHQTLPIADNNANYMAEITGNSKATTNTWNKFVFSADLMGMKGVQDNTKRKTFTINGSINADNESVSLSNMTSFGGMQITYDFNHNRLIGSLDFKQTFSSVSITGHADFLTDSDGWLFLAGGSLTTPGFGQLKAGLGIGDYGNMNVKIQGNSIKERLVQEAHNKYLPDAFQNGFSGFYFTGMKDIPQLSLPKTGFNFLFVKGSLEITTGFDAQLWMGFDDSGAEFGIGVMAFAELTLMLDVAITCTTLYGYLGAELAVKGYYNTGNGTFSLDGCASITLAGAVEQCFPVSALVPIIPPVCEGCGTSCDVLGVKAIMSFDSDGNIDAGFALGSCSGNNPLSQEIKSQFNCN